LQEWLQPEGDQISAPPLESIKTLLGECDYPIIVKEVGQGFGQASISALLRLPLEALDLAGFGGTNFSKLELLRSDDMRMASLGPVLNIGHTCEEMIQHINELKNQTFEMHCKQIIISGGVRGFLDGYYYMEKCQMPNLYAQASGFLKHALDYNELKRYMDIQIQGLRTAYALLRVK